MRETPAAAAPRSGRAKLTVSTCTRVKPVVSRAVCPRVVPKTEPEECECDGRVMQLWGEDLAKQQCAELVTEEKKKKKKVFC